MWNQKGSKVVVVYGTYDVPRVVIISYSDKVGVYGNGNDNDERNENRETDSLHV